MTDFANLLKPDRGEDARVIHVVDKLTFDEWKKSQHQSRRDMLDAIRFDGKTVFQFAILQGKTADKFEVVTCVEEVDNLGPWELAKLGEALPEGTYRVDGSKLGQAGLGWLLAQHKFRTYKSDPNRLGPRVLLSDEPARIDQQVREAHATAWVRDLVNTPALDLGPADLEKEARALGSRCKAEVEVIAGKDLVDGYPMINAVGMAASEDREPRLVELRWGDKSHPKVAIVGKGVCFDTGGLDIKPSSGMRLMKKDMGGAAHAMALAQLVMDAKLKIRLHLLVPAVENSISGSALRPGDVVQSRKGLSVEIDNTDAEGRLILADALQKAAEDEPEMILDFATLTGAARVALGPELPAMFTNDDELAGDFVEAARSTQDPIWRMPLWDDYDDMLKSEIADMTNSGDSPMAGAVVAAMFLNRFIPEKTPWAHVDTFAWHPSAKPGRPKGGEALGLRAAFELLRGRYGSS